LSTFQIITTRDRSDSAALRDIVSELSGIPLAIEQSAALIRNGNFSFQKFLSAYKQKYRALMEEPPDEGSWAYDKDRIILTVLDLAYASLETRPNDALLLVFIGIMGSWQIPVSVLGRFAFFHHDGTKSIVDEEIAQLESLLNDDNFLRLALHRLAKFFFIRLSGDQQHQSIAIHRIFSQWSLEKIRSLGKEELLIHAAYGLSREVCNVDPEMKR
jgi:predicted ATPase